MRGTLALVGGAGLGAGLMYLLDPERGERRRTALSDSLACAVNDAADRFPAVASAAAGTVTAARQVASRLEAPRFVSDLTARLDAPRRVADFTEAPRRAAALRPDSRSRLIAWQTVEGALVEHSGTARFRPTADDGTRVEVTMSWRPAGGGAGEAIAFASGLDPEHALREGLAAFKARVEEEAIAR